jgi:dipeptidyl aminopeptidase/acylaminoacyl peptidase
VKSRLRFLPTAVGAALAFCPLAAAPAQPAEDMNFLQFPFASEVHAGRGGAFAWLVRQGGNTTIMFTRAPGFERVKLFSRTDTDGQPVTALTLSPDGRYVVFTTGSPMGGGRAFNPASQIEPPVPTAWLIETRAGAKPVQIKGNGHAFSPSGDALTYRDGKDLWTMGLPAPSPAAAAAPGEPKLLVKGGAALGRPVWTKDGKTLLFIQDRGGYGFVGRYTLGQPGIEWLVTGANRLSSLTLSPDEKTIAWRRLRGREHDKVYDITESEPFAIDSLDFATGKVRTLWDSEGAKATGGAEDADSDLRWDGNDRIIFHSEHDGWGRLYAVARTGGAIRALTPAHCEVAESEAAGPHRLLISHNCGEVDGRQLTLVDTAIGREQALKLGDLVAAAPAASEDSAYVAFIGGDADNAPLLRVLDADKGRIVMAERPADYGYARTFAAPAPKAVRLRATDGADVPAQLFLPAGKGPHPALVYVHGGPPRQMFPAFHYMGYYANDYAINRRLAERGYVVVRVNYRSGTGYGRDYREAANRGWRAASEYQDVLGAGQWLAARPDVDPNRIGIWGGSYGGLLTGQALARNSDLFKAGVAVHGVFDWSWPTPREGHLNPNRAFGVDPEQKALARKNSPVGAIAGWRSPVLLFSGDQDMNVDVLETVDLARKLRDRKVDVRVVLLPGEAHDFVRQSGYARLWAEQIRFFDETLGKK